MKKIFNAPLIGGYDPDKDKTGKFMQFNIVGESWKSTEDPPKVNGAYLLAVWDGYSMGYDLCYYLDGKWEVTNDWYEGEPIAYVAWMEVDTISPLG